MKKYKIQFTQSQDFIIDVYAKNEVVARELAKEKWENSTFDDYPLNDPIIEISAVYDVTNTDDPFNP